MKIVDVIKKVFSQAQASDPPDKKEEEPRVRYLMHKGILYKRVKLTINRVNLPCPYCDLATRGCSEELAKVCEEGEYVWEEVTNPQPEQLAEVLAQQL
jgi:hypothetical protein